MKIPYGVPEGITTFEFIQLAAVRDSVNTVRREWLLIQSKPDEMFILSGSAQIVAEKKEGEEKNSFHIQGAKKTVVLTDGCL